MHNSTLATARSESVRNTQTAPEKHLAASSAVAENNNAGPEVPPDGLICVNAGSVSLMSTLQVAIKDGRSLLIEDIGTSVDPVLDPVLCHRTFSKVRKLRGKDLLMWAEHIILSFCWRFFCAFTRWRVISSFQSTGVSTTGTSMLQMAPLLRIMSD